MSFLDIIFIVFLAYFTIKGFKKGLVTSFCGVAGNLLSLAGAFLYYKPLAGVLTENLRFDNFIRPWVHKQTALPVTNINEIDIPEYFSGFINGSLEKMLDFSLNQGFSSIQETLTGVMTNYLIDIISLLTIFFVLKLIFNIVLPSMLQNKTLMPIRLVDKAGGAILGALMGSAIITCIIIFLMPLISINYITDNQWYLNEIIKDSLGIKVLLTYAIPVFDKFFINNGYIFIS